MEKEDNQTKLDEIYEQLEDGRISTTEAIRQSNALTAEMATKEAIAEANKRTQDLLTDKDVEVAESEWYKTYPDYDEVVASGKLQPYIDRNPLLVDETIAYFQFKADQRFEEGKAETKAASKEPDGMKFLSRDALEDHQMSTVLKMKNHRPTRQEPITLKEIENQQMSTLKKMRGEV